MTRRWAPAYFAGAVAALAVSLALWVVAQAELLSALGVSLRPALTWDWLSGRVLFGSLFALGLPLVRRHTPNPIRAGMLLSLAPSFIELFYLLPNRNHGMLGVELGALMPVVVLATNGTWGWLVGRMAGGGGEPAP